jgi:hypothetical protein
MSWRMCSKNITECKKCKIMETDNYSINSNISWKLLKDKVVAVNLDDGNYYTFNMTASLIWQYIDQEKTVNEIVSLLKIDFPGITEQTLNDDINDIINYWISEKLVYIR